jgi:hypothetical protein
MSLIMLRKGTRKELRERFKCSESALSLIIHFKWNSMTARRVRSYAVNVLKAFPILN